MNPALADFSAPAGQLTLRLSALIAEPFTSMGHACDLDAALLEPLSASPVGRAALDRHLCETLQLQEIPFDRSLVKRFATEDQARLAAELVLAPIAQTEFVLAHLAAAIFQARIQTAVMRRDRVSLTKHLGDAAMTYGMRTAPTFAKALAELNPASLAIPPLDDDAPTPPLQENPLLQQGLALASALVASVDPGLARLFDLQHAKGPVTHPALSDRQAAQAWRLIERSLSE